MTEESKKTFETLSRELVETVEKLETGDLSLEESLTLFERATALAAECNALLDQAELRVRQLTSGSQDEIEAEPFTGWERE
jgi:exodeoxyribonuclease VII small subunit